MGLRGEFQIANFNLPSAGSLPAEGCFVTTKKLLENVNKNEYDISQWNMTQ